MRSHRAALILLFWMVVNPAGGHGGPTVRRPLVPGHSGEPPVRAAAPAAPIRCDEEGKPELELQPQIDSVNAEIREKKLNFSAVTIDEILVRLDKAGAFYFFVKDRERLAEAFRRGKIPCDAQIKLVQHGRDIPDRIVLKLSESKKSGSLATELSIREENDKIFDVRRDLEKKPESKAGEVFKSPLPSKKTVLFPKNVEVRITPIQVPGKTRSGVEPRHRNGLDIALLVSQDNIPNIAHYFNVGHDRKTLEKQLRTLVGSGPKRWINLKEILPNWVGKRVNTFTTNDDCDVCWIAAAEFFREKPNRKELADPDALTVLMEDFYCRISPEVEPRFGDILLVPGIHAGRYVMTDPNSGRGIAFAVNSGGAVPYRFWWMDEEFALQGKADPKIRKTRLDVWRRCEADKD